MSSVSQKMHHISTSQGIIKAKRNFGEIFLTLEGDGYIFYINKEFDEGPCFVYDASTPTVTRRILPNQREQAWENGSAKPITSFIIESFVAAMSDVLSKFSFDTIRIDKKFIEKCLPILQKHKLREMSLYKPSFEENINASILIHEALYELTINEADPSTLTMFDEQFMREFSLNDDQKYSLEVHETFDEPFRWSPDREFLPIFCRYKRIHLSSLTLTIPLLMELISISIGKVACYTQWSFSVTNELTEADFAPVKPSKNVEVKQESDMTKFIVKIPDLEADCTVTNIGFNRIYMVFENSIEYDRKFSNH